MVMLRCGDRDLETGSRTLIMGVVNATPDSFSDGGRFPGDWVDPERVVAHAERLLREGADILDIGGESTRPGAAPVPPDEELERVLPAIERLVARGIRNISVDTRHATTAAACLDAGASWVNDVSALQHDPAMGSVAARADAVVLMHAREMSPGEAGDRVTYVDVVAEVRAYLEARVRAAVAAGVARERIVVDPGIGFGKSVADNLALLRGGQALAALGPLLVGPSRKRFLGTLTGIEEPARRDAATLGAVCWAALHGAAIVRVHDVAGAVQALKVVDALRSPAVTATSAG